MKNLKVLIVEDELLIAETLKLHIHERGHKVVGIAISYDEAIQILEIELPDIILLDIRLYGAKSGIDLAKDLSKLGLNIPYIIVSSQYDSRIIEDAMLAGATGYLTKPISKETLWSSLESVMVKYKEKVATDVNSGLNFED